MPLALWRLDFIKIILLSLLLYTYFIMPLALWLLSAATAPDLLFDFCLLRLFTIMPQALWLLGFICFIIIIIIIIIFILLCLLRFGC